MGNWKYIGKKRITCPHCGQEISCEIRLKLKENKIYEKEKI